MSILDCDVLVVGCGSGGIGSAIGAARKGASVVVLDANHMLGGVVTMSWVHNWEPTCGSSPLTRRMWEHMKSLPGGAVDMEFTTSRNHPDGKRKPTMPFEIWAYLKVVDEEFRNAGNIRLLLNIRLVSCSLDGRKIKTVQAVTGGCEFQIRAKTFIDATGDLGLARMAGCECLLGTDSKADFDEPDAPEKADRNNLNEVNWLYRISPCDHDVEVDDSPIPERARIGGHFKAKLPNGDYIINICGSGHFSPERIEDHERVFAEQRQLAYDTYRWLVRSGCYPNYRLVGLAPQMGIRESYRLKARRILTENDVLRNHKKLETKDCVALTDHVLDVHGTNLEARLGSMAYGIPYDCLLPNEYDNLFVGSRGIGATHIVAGSCRLSRTVMTFGLAAGGAAAICAKEGKNPEDINVSDIADYET